MQVQVNNTVESSREVDRKYSHEAITYTFLMHNLQKSSQ